MTRTTQAPPRRRARHARRRRRRPGLGGVVLAVAAALALAGAVPLGILAARVLHPPAAARVAVPATVPSSSAPPVQQRPVANPSPIASAAAAAPGSEFSVTAGPECRPAAAAVTFAYRAPGGDGWHLGVATRDGPCGSAFSYSYLADLPAATGQWHDHYAWIVHTGLSFAYCDLSFWIPAAAQAGAGAYYWFSDGPDDPALRLADFTLDQRSSQGHWVTKGPFTFPGGTVLIEVTDRGGPATATAAAGPVRVSC